MLVHDLSSDPGIGVIADLLQNLTRARTAQQAFEAFMTRYWRFRPVEHFMGIALDSSGPGRFRVLFHVDSCDVAHGGNLPTRNPSAAAVENLPVFEGGVIADAMTTPAPKWITGIETSREPALSSIGGLINAMAVPIFAGDAVTEWLFAFSTEIVEIAPRDAQQALLTANLMAMTNAQMTLVEEVGALNRRLSAQLEEVAQLQQALLPEKLPDIPGLKIATSYLTSDQAGGDYYDFFPLPDGRWGILIADVSGHGAAAATVMAMLHGILHCYAGPESGPELVLGYANAKLLQAGINGNFVTAFLAMYDPSDATMMYASSGHNPPRLKEGRSGAVRGIEEPAALPLGILEPYEITSGSIPLSPNDTVVMYTDGITEEFSAAREMFGVERLDAALDTCSGDPECVVGSVHGALFEHTRSRTRADDQTIVAFRYIGPEGGLGRDALSRQVMAGAAAALAGASS